MTSLPRRFLVPLDGSRLAENAIPLAKRLSQIFEADIRFIQVIDEELDAAERARAAEIFAEYTRARAAHFGLANDCVESEVLCGEPSEVILGEARRSETVAIALATHGRGGFRATVFGSVADRVIRGADVPVLVVPGVGGPPTEIDRILVPVDGSGGAVQALPAARRIAEAEGAAVTIVRAYMVAPPGSMGYVYYPPEIPDAIVAEVHAYVAMVAERGERTLALRGDAGTVILQVINDLDIDLIVMSKTGKGLTSRIAIGSVTDRVLHTAHRPMLIMPAAPGHRLEPTA